MTQPQPSPPPPVVVLPDPLAPEPAPLPPTKVVETNTKTQFYVSLAALFLSLVYQAIIGAMATQVTGFTLPPVDVYILSVMGPVVLLGVHALPSVFKGSA